MITYCQNTDILRASFGLGRKFAFQIRFMLTSPSEGREKAIGQLKASI